MDRQQQELLQFFSPLERELLQQPLGQQQQTQQQQQQQPVRSAGTGAPFAMQEEQQEQQQQQQQLQLQLLQQEVEQRRLERRRERAQRIALFGPLASLAIAREEAAHLDNMYIHRRETFEWLHDPYVAPETSSEGTPRFNRADLPDDSDFTYEDISAIEALDWRMVVIVWMYHQNAAFWATCRYFGRQD